MTQVLLKDNYLDIIVNNHNELDYDILSFKFINFRRWLKKQGSNSYTTYIIDQNEVNNLDLVSYEVYGSSDYWWILAVANNIMDPVNDIKYQTKLIIPTVSAINTYITSLSKTEEQQVIIL